MGWFGDYRNVSDVMGEKEGEIERTDVLRVVDTKETKSYGIILYVDSNTHEYFIESFIFSDSMYKPINFLDNYTKDFKRIPSKWHKYLSQNPEQKQIIEKQKELINQEKKKNQKNREKLENLLIPGKKYSVWNGQHEAIYLEKIKRSYIFKLSNGQRIRFRNLKHTDIQEIS